MKRLIANIFLCIPISIFGQGLIQESPLYFGDIDSIIEVRKVNSGCQIDTSYLESKTEVYTTVYKLAQNNLLKTIYTIDSDPTYREEYHYDTNNNIISIKHDTYSNGTWGTHLYKYIYKSKKRKRIKKFESWSTYRINDSMALNYYCDDVIYTGEKLTSFREYNIDMKGDTIPMEVYKLYYDKSNRLEYYDEVYYDSIPFRMIFVDDVRVYPVLLDKPLISYRTRFYYDQKGLMYKKQLIGMEKEQFESYQEEYIWLYEYDENNNFIKHLEKFDDYPFRLKFERIIVYK